jgi:hypothetical protein
MENVCRDDYDTGVVEACDTAGEERTLNHGTNACGHGWGMMVEDAGPPEGGMADAGPMMMGM